MQEVIPFLPDQQSANSALAGHSPVAINIVVDGNGAIRRRPGISAHDLGGSTAIDSNPIVGMFALTDQRVYAAAGVIPGALEIYRLVSGGAVNITHGVASDLTASFRPTWAETESLVLLATGRSIHRIERNGEDIAILSQDAPLATHVIAHNARVLANSPGTNVSRVRYTAPQTGESSYAGHTQWTNTISAIGRSGFFNAESRPDKVVAVAENSNEVFVFGTTTLQTFAPDSAFVYAPVATREFGCSAPYSIVKDDQSFAWLDSQRRFVHTDGRSVSILSDQISSNLNDLSKADDCFGYRVLDGNVDALVWTFPTDKQTFCFQRGGGWSLWHGWDNAANNWSHFTVTAHTAVPGSNANLVGTSAGRTGVFDRSANTDLGAIIPAHVTTGFLDRGTDMRKHCRSVRLILERGTVTDTTEPIVHLRWRDDQGPWSGPLEVSLGTGGDRYPVVEFRSLGIYRRRQWRIDFHGTGDFALAKATEEFDVLGN